MGRKMIKYAHLVVGCKEGGLGVRLCPVEVGTKGFVKSSTTRQLRDLGLLGKGLSE